MKRPAPIVTSRAAFTAAEMRRARLILSCAAWALAGVAWLFIAAIVMGVA